MDIAFLGEKLYGITHTKDLVSLGIDFDCDGGPNITRIERLIRPTPSRRYRLHVWKDDDDNSEARNEDDIDEVEVHDNYDELNEEDDENDCALNALRKQTGDDMVLEGIVYLQDIKVPYNPHPATIRVTWNLIESRGKLLMVRRHLRVPYEGINCTCKVEVFKASKGVWVRVSGGLAGQALFVSKHFCRSISTYGDIEEDTIYFADTGETFDTKSQIMSPPKRGDNYWQSMWMFSPDLVV
jgi:hypothetical protein